MGKSGAVNSIELDRLLDERLEMQAKIKKVRLEVEREYKPRIEEEIEYRTRSLERAFAVRFVEIKEAGATYAELVKVLGQGTAAVMRKYVELGGGKIQKRLTGSERADERKNSTGVRHVADNRYIWTVDGEEFEADLLWQRGKPVLFPVGDAVVTLRDNHGVNSADLVTKGAEVAAAFDISEPN